MIVNQSKKKAQKQNMQKKLGGNSAQEEVKKSSHPSEHAQDVLHQRLHDNKVISKVFECSKCHKPRSSTIHEGNECSLCVFKEITNSFIISSKEAQERIKEYQNDNKMIEVLKKLYNSDNSQQEMKLDPNLTNQNPILREALYSQVETMEKCEMQEEAKQNANISQAEYDKSYKLTSYFKYFNQTEDYPPLKEIIDDLLKIFAFKAEEIKGYYKEYKYNPEKCVTKIWTSDTAITKLINFALIVDACKAFNFGEARLIEIKNHIGKLYGC